MKATPAIMRATAAGLALSLAITTSGRAEGGTAADLVGAWSLVSLDVHRGEERIAVFGTEPRGIQIMSQNGRFAVVTLRSELPLYASANRLAGTTEEYEAIGKGSNAAYGRYTVDEAAGTVTFHVEASTFPNWEGDDQVRAFTVEGDIWAYVNPVPAIGPGNVHVVWKRIP